MFVSLEFSFCPCSWFTDCVGHIECEQKTPFSRLCTGNRTCLRKLKIFGTKRKISSKNLINILNFWMAIMRTLIICWKKSSNFYQLDENEAAASNANVFFTFQFIAQRTNALDSCLVNCHHRIDSFFNWLSISNQSFVAIV